MISLPDQFSAARLTQLDNGFKLMRSLSEQALDRTSRVFALQLDASRAAVEQSSNTLRQLFTARDPRDLLALGSQSQQQLRSMFDYSRELFSIAAGVDLPAPRVYRVDTPALGAPATPSAEDPATTQAAAEAFERIGGDTASVTASVIASEAANAAANAAPSIILQADAVPAGPQAQATDFVLPTETASATPAADIEVVTSDIAPSAEPTVIAKVTSEALDVPVAPPHPLAASVPVEVAVEIELPKVEPVEALPPPAAPTTGPVETRGTKGRKKGP